MRLDKINSLNIRPIKGGDKKNVIEMWHKCGLFKRGSLDAENEFIVAKLLPRSEIFVAEENGEIVAVVLGALSHTSGWIWDLAVDPLCQKQGIGKAIIRQAENWIKQEGGERCMLFLQGEGDALQSFYTGLSYTNVTDNIMQKPLA